MSIKVTIKEARKLALLSQKVYQANEWGRGLNATRKVIQHLGYVQIDTISVIERAHHHTLWNRVNGYKMKHLDQLLKERKIFEYWSHAAAYLPIEDYRFYLHRMAQYENGERHWFDRNEKIMNEVYCRIRDEGPLRARDFESKGVKQVMWESRPTKQALEQLFIEGKLMISQRTGFQKTFDLRERVLPSTVCLDQPNAAEFARFLINRYLNANGFGSAAEIAYLRKGWKPEIQMQLNQMQEEKEIYSLEVVGIGSENRLTNNYYCKTSVLSVLEKRLARNTLKILSPFDNLVIQRKRIEWLFGYQFQLECYVPSDKRQFGYFVLPVIVGEQLVAKLDLKADRQQRLLIINNLVTESNSDKIKDLGQLLSEELNRFAKFCGCDNWRMSDKIENSFVNSLLDYQSV